MPTDPKTDQTVPILQALLARTALKDRAAFTQLYEHTAPQLLAVALRIVRRRDRAEDVLQDAFVNVWHHADSYAASLATPMTWLTSITRNKALDLLRHVKTADHANLDDSELALENLPDDRAEPSRLLDAGMAQMHVQQCMASMSAPQRQALALAYFHGLSHSELALQLASPLGTVKAWVRRGLDKLKTCLEARGAV
jgi:RNA polymerase sigma-70 factor, ECF subfamily